MYSKRDEYDSLLTSGLISKQLPFSNKALTFDYFTLHLFGTLSLTLSNCSFISKLKQSWECTTYSCVSWACVANITTEDPRYILRFHLQLCSDCICRLAYFLLFLLS